MLVEVIFLLSLIAFCCAAESSESEEPMLGMGRRHYAGEGRLDITYTTELATPHIDWADPYTGGAVSVFAIPSVMEGRTLVELMQRLSMGVDAVTIDPAWDVNKWTMSFGEAYGARSERTADGALDYSLTYQYLEDDVTGDKRWDVMVMHGILGWGHLPQTVRDAILRRVREGMGLVIVGPLAGPGGGGLADLSPLMPTSDSVDDAVHPQAWSAFAGAWQGGAAHFITDGVPLETFPADNLRHRRYRLAEGASLLATAAGDPVVAIRQVGEGRVVAFGYENYGLAPYIRWDAYGTVGDAWWETWYSLLIRAIIWSAKKEPGQGIAVALSRDVVHLTDAEPVRATITISGAAPDGGEVLWQVRDDDGAIKAGGRAACGGECEVAIPVADLDAGRHIVDVFLVNGDKRINWASRPLVLASDVRIQSVTAPDAVEEGRTVGVQARLTGMLPPGAAVEVELVDNYQRVIARDLHPQVASDGLTVAADLEISDPLTHIGWARVTLRQGQRILDRAQVRVAFATPDRQRVWDDYEVNIPFYGPRNYYHWMPLADEQYRRAGVTWLMEPERNFRFTVLAQPGGLGVYYYDRKPFEEQIAKYWETGDRQYLRRDPCLHRDWRDQAKQIIRQKIEPFLKYRPFHYYISDEPSITSYTRAFDLCYSPETVAAFRKWLRREYGSLTALNSEWDSGYAKWEQIEPPTTLEAQRECRIPAWADFRRFMDLTFADAFRYTQKVVRELDPGGLALVGGTQMPTPFDGSDWWLMSRAFGILEPYFGIDAFHSFNPDLPIIQACGYQDAGTGLEEEIWRRALQGQRGATIFWNYTFHDPDLVLNSQGEAMRRAFGALRGDGIARLLMGARRDDSRIAILYSQMSLYAAWIQDGDPRSGKSHAAERWNAAQNLWKRAITHLGLQYRVISYEQLAKGGLDGKGCDVLILPQSHSLSDAEVTAIRDFAAAGGLVLTDADPGRFDEHCKTRGASPLSGSENLHLFAAASDDADASREALVAWLRPLLGRVGAAPVAAIPDASLELVHFVDGKAAYIATMRTPEEAYRVTFSRIAHVYDMRARSYLGLTDTADVPAGNARVSLYALLPEKVTAVHVSAPTSAAPGDAISYAVSAEAAAPFRHVFAVRVYCPDGSPRHMYAANIESRRGPAAGQFALALNDLPGDWKIVATDAATGVTGETTFRVE